MTDSPVPVPPRPEPICGMVTWMPAPARILDVREENFNTRTFTMEFVDEELRRMYHFIPGQFNMIYVPGVGEAAISMSSHPSRPQTIAHTIRKVGSVTRAVDRLQDGIVGLRGPFGRGWPMEEMRGHDIVIVAGGIGIAPLRPVIYWILEHRAEVLAGVGSGDGNRVARPHNMFENRIFDQALLHDKGRFSKRRQDSWQDKGLQR